MTSVSIPEKDDRVHRLVVLPFFKSVEIAYKSIRVRFFRSLITTMSLVLAISFLSFVNITNDVVNSLMFSADPEIRQSLAKAGYDVQPDASPHETSARQQWIIVLSLLVCVVGIVNAQLMAVTERFREIGTMKCLGALDRFVLRLFLLEASIQGLAGAGVGAVAGAVFALLNSMLKFGFASMTDVSWPALMGSIGISMITGCFLSLVGVLYPALVASRMQPVEAMRIEQ